MMLRAVFIPSILVLCALVCCMGQTFQYSRGWTNGKRSNSHYHEDSLMPELVEYDIEKKLEKCLINLQRIIHNPYLLQHSSLQNKFATSGSNSQIGHHQSNEILDEINGPEPNDFLKNQS